MHIFRSYFSSSPLCFKKLILIIFVHNVIGQSSLVDILLSKSALAYLYQEKWTQALQKGQFKQKDSQSNMIIPACKIFPGYTTLRLEKYL